MSDNNEPIYSTLNGKGNGTWWRFGEGPQPQGATTYTCEIGSWWFDYGWSQNCLGPYNPTPSPYPSFECTEAIEMEYTVNGWQYYVPCYNLA